jgi:hypothetical protein
VDAKSLFLMLAPPQLSEGAKGLAKLVGSLQGCSPNSMGAEPATDYPQGSQMCYTVNGSTYPVTLLEDLSSDRMATLVRLPDGRTTTASNDWLSDISNCMRGER